MRCPAHKLRPVHLLQLYGLHRRQLRGARQLYRRPAPQPQPAGPFHLRGWRNEVRYIWADCQHSIQVSGTGCSCNCGLTALAWPAHVCLQLPKCCLWQVLRAAPAQLTLTSPFTQHWLSFYPALAFLSPGTGFEALPRPTPHPRRSRLHCSVSCVAIKTGVVTPESNVVSFTTNSNPV